MCRRTRNAHDLEAVVAGVGDDEVVTLRVVGDRRWVVEQAVVLAVVAVARDLLARLRVQDDDLELERVDDDDAVRCRPPSRRSAG